MSGLNSEWWKDSSEKTRNIHHILCRLCYTVIRSSKSKEICSEKALHIYLLHTTNNNIIVVLFITTTMVFSYVTPSPTYHTQQNERYDKRLETAQYQHFAPFLMINSLPICQTKGKPWSLTSRNIIKQSSKP